MEHRHVVLAKPEMAEATGQLLGIHEQIGNYDDQGPLANRLGQLVEHLRQSARPLRPHLLQRIEHQPQMGGIPPRRQVPDDCVGHAGDADRVSLAAGQEAERARELAGVVDPRDAGGAVAHRAAGIDDEAAPQVGVGLILLDVVAIRAAVDPPVEPTEVIARHILSVLGKLNARPAVRADMTARHAADHRPAGEQRHRGKPREHAAVEKRPC